MYHSSNVAQDEAPQESTQESAETVQTNLRLRADLRKRAEHLRVERGDSVSAVVNECLEMALPTLEAQLASGSGVSENPRPGAGPANKQRP